MLNKTQRLQRWFEERPGPDVEPYGEYMHVGANQSLVRVLLEGINITPATVVLDAACGLGGNARWLASLYDCRVYGNDIDEDALETARELAVIEHVDHLCTFVSTPAESLSFDDSIFDIVLSTEGVYDAGEVRRVLKPGGRFMFTNYFSDREVTPEGLAGEYGMDLELAHDVTQVALAFHRAKEAEARLLTDANMLDTRQLVQLMNATIKPYAIDGGRHLLMRLRRPG